MKIIQKITIIEATPDDIRQSNTLAECIAGVFRRAFNGAVSEDEEDDDEE